MNEKEENKKQYYPIVELLYCNSTGLEDFGSYHSQIVGRAGTGSVNDYTGKLVFVHGDTATPSSRMPVVVSHVYNSTQDEWNFVHNPKDFGKGSDYDAYPRTDMGMEAKISKIFCENRRVYGSHKI